VSEPLDAREALAEALGDADGMGNASYLRAAGRIIDGLDARGFGIEPFAAPIREPGLRRSDLELIDAEASTAHDYIWNSSTDGRAEPVTREQASAAIWSIHNLVRAAAALTPTQPVPSGLDRQPSDQPPQWFLDEARRQGTPDPIATPPAADSIPSLDAAWAEAEAACKARGYRLTNMADHGDWYGGWYVVANDAKQSSSLTAIGANGKTFAAALHALAARLSSSPSEPRNG